mgnify:CR=1 FL=1
MTEKQMMVEYLLKKYGHPMMTRQECAEALSISTSTLDRNIKSAIVDMPKYKRLGRGSRSKILFPVNEVAGFISPNYNRTSLVS